jgi:hypothetical protein
VTVFSFIRRRPSGYDGTSPPSLKLRRDESAVAEEASVIAKASVVAKALPDGMADRMASSCSLFQKLTFHDPLTKHSPLCWLLTVTGQLKTSQPGSNQNRPL